MELVKQPSEMDEVELKEATAKFRQEFKRLREESGTIRKSSRSVWETMRKLTEEKRIRKVRKNITLK